MILIFCRCSANRKYLKTNLFQVLVVVNIETIWVVEDVGDEEPAKHGHLDPYLKAKIVEFFSFFVNVPNRDNGKGLEQCQDLSC